jgi:transposase
MISMYQFEKVRALISAGRNDSEISRELGIHRQTVAKYRHMNTPPKYPRRTGRTREDPTTDFIDQISHWMSQHPDISAPSVYSILLDQGYRGSLRTVERRIESIRGRQPKERFFEQHYEPGEQAQFDFKESVELPFRDGPRLCHLFFGTLPYSDDYFAKAFPNKTFEAFSEGVHSFFERLGGMTENIRFDNLSPVVKKVLKGSERIYTQAFERMRAYYGWGLLPCSPGKGSDKGDCERDIRTFSRRIIERIKLLGLCFKDIHELNDWLDDFARRQRTESVAQKLSVEISKLRPDFRR